MIYLCCDTNIWINISNSEEPTRLLDLLYDEIANDTIKLILPEIIIKEWARNKEDKIVKRTKENIKTQITGLYKLTNFIQNERGNVFDDTAIKEEISELSKKVKALELELKKYKIKLSETAHENIALVENIFGHKNTIILKTDKSSSMSVVSLASE